MEFFRLTSYQSLYLPMLYNLDYPCLTLRYACLNANALSGNVYRAGLLLAPIKR